MILIVWTAPSSGHDEGPYAEKEGLRNDDDDDAGDRDMGEDLVLRRRKDGRERKNYGLAHFGVLFLMAAILLGIVQYI